MESEFIKVKNIYKSFAGVQALEDVSMTINRGEVRCLAGENGSGKSTLIKIIAGVYTRDKGEVIINGHNYKTIRPIDAIKEGIQIIYQDFSLFPNLTVAENLAMNYLLSKESSLVSWGEIRNIAKKALEKIGLDIDINARVEDLSVADKQLVAISRALLHDAKLIVMDEPTTALTRKEVETLFSIIRNLKEKNISILFVSHKLNEVFEISDTITILRNGKRVFDGYVNEINRKELEYYMTGREIKSTKDLSFNKSVAEPILEVKNLYRKNKIKNVSFKVHKGEILGITGLLGSGRTALALTLFGMDPADSGEIFIDGKKIEINSAEDAIKEKIAYVPEDRLTEGLLLEQSIKNNINICTVDQLINNLKLIDGIKFNDQAKKWIKELKIKTSSAELPVKSLSGGNQQRVVLAKWLATLPRVLILNGPTVGVDVGSKEEIHNIIKNLADAGMGVILISDDIPEVSNNCNRILLMRNGQIVKEFQGNEVTEEHLAEALLG